MEFAGQRLETKAGSDGHWRVDLAPMPACRKGRVLTVCGGRGATALPAIAVNDVLVGEVWLCAGQSNMGVPLCGGNPRYRDRQVVNATGDGDIAFAAGARYRQITHGIGFVVRLANMDRITAKRPPANVEKDVYGLNEYWATRGNEGNPSTAWTGRLGPKGDGLSVRDLSAAEVAHRKYWFEHVQKMQKTPGWEEVYIANTCSQIGPRATRIFECDYITDRAEIRKPGYAPKDVVGWFGADGAHEAFPVAYRQLLPVGCENVLCAGRMLGAPDTIDTFRLICPCFVTGQAAGVAAALCAKGNVPPRSLPYSELRTALGNSKVFLG